MYTLYYAPGAASLAVHWMLIELGVPFELVKLDLDAKAQKQPSYLKLNPSGVVPTLVIDGKPYAETAALLMLLAERHPEKHLAPAPGDAARGEFLQWMFYFANTMQPTYRLWFYGDEAAGPGNEEAAKAQARARIEAAWALVDDKLSGRQKYFLGEKPSAVDFLATMLARWSRNMPKPAQTWPHVGAYVARMKKMPSLIEVHKREGLTEWIGQ
jgi:glutathione S-transferase